MVKSLSLETDECDVIVERCDGSKYYLEIFCIMPNFQEDEDGFINGSLIMDNYLSLLGRGLSKRKKFIFFP